MILLWKWPDDMTVDGGTAFLVDFLETSAVQSCFWKISMQHFQANEQPQVLFWGSTASITYCRYAILLGQDIV